MRISSMIWLIPLVLTPSAWCQDASIAPSAAYEFAALGIIPGQTLRVNLLNTVRLPASAALPSLPCQVVVRIYDSGGKLTKEETIEDLAAGTVKWVDYGPQAAIAIYPPPRFTLAAVVQVSTTKLAASPLTPPNYYCSVLPSLEVFDTATNKTVVAWQGPLLKPPILPYLRRLSQDETRPVRGQYD